MSAATKSPVTIGPEHSANAAQRRAAKDSGAKGDPPAARAPNAAEIAFLHRANAFFITLAGVPLLNYAQGVGVALFADDLRGLNAWRGDPTMRSAMLALRDEGRACASGPFAHLGQKVVDVVSALTYDNAADPRPVADFTTLAALLRKENMGRAKALSKGGGQ